MIDAGIVLAASEPRLLITDSDLVWADREDLNALESLDVTRDLLPNVQACRYDNFRDFIEFRAVVPCITALAVSS